MYKLENNELLTDEIKKAFCKNYTYCILRNNNLTIDINNYLKKLNYTDEKYDSVDGSFLGKAACRTIDVELVNAEGLEIENQEFELLLGAKTNDGVIHYINYGKFIVIEPPTKKDVKGTINFTADDYMSKFNVKFDATGLEFPCTVERLAEFVCEQCGIELGSTSFRNSNKMIYQNPFINNEQCRIVITSIAKISFSVAYIGQDNKLYFKFENTDTIVENITTNNYFELEPNEETKPITVITLRHPEIEASSVSIRDEELIKDYGENELVIAEEYFTVTNEERLEFLNGVKDLFGLMYHPINLELEGNIYLDFNDRIKNTDLQGNIRETYCLNTYFQYNGVLFNSIKAEALTQNENAYNYETKEDLKNRITEVRINKAEQKIELLVSKTDDYDEEISKISIDLNSLQLTVEKNIDFIRNKKEINQLFLENIKAGTGYVTNFKIFGNNHYFTTNEITIIASSKNREFFENLLSEDEQDILTENEINIETEEATYYLGKFDIILDDKLREHTVGETTYYDTLEILQDGTCKVTRRIGVNEDGSLYLLPIEREIILQEQVFLPSDYNGTYYYIKNLNGIEYESNYIIQNNYSDYLANKAELKAGLEVKVDTDKMISEINGQADIIKLIGNRFILDSTNCKISEDGTIIAKNGIFNGKITSDEGTIGGFNLNKDNFYKEYNMNYQYTLQDVLLVLWYLNGMISLDSNVKKLLDINDNGDLNLQDVILILNYLKGQHVEYNKLIHGEVIIDSNNPNETISITNDLGIPKTRLGIFSMFCHAINCDSLMLGTEYANNTAYGIFLDAYNRQISLVDSASTTTIKPSEVKSPKITQTSLATEKKNFEKLENALDIIKDIDIYKYNLKFEKDTDKKHIGFVIGKDFNYSREVASVDENGKEVGADIYSFVSVLCKGLQEQNEKIEKLQSEIQDLKNNLKMEGDK